MKFLNDEERDRHRTQHKRERDRRVCDRIKAVLLFDKGWSYNQISDLRLTGKRLGLLINFGRKSVKEGIGRVVNGL